MNKKPAISFFCPAYNDEKNLPILIPKTDTLLKSVCSAYEIVIIDDASPDSTNKVADQLAKQYPNVNVIHHKKNKGYGGALLSGFLHAKKYPFVFYTDGDNQYDVSALKKMLPYIDDNDAVVGKRKMRKLSKKRKLQSVCYNWIIRLLFGVKNEDINCAIRIIKREYINKLHLSSSSAFLPAEIIIALHKNNAKIKQIEVVHYERAFGEASGGKLSVIIPTFTEMIKYFLKQQSII